MCYLAQLVAVAEDRVTLQCAVEDDGVHAEEMRSAAMQILWLPLKEACMKNKKRKRRKAVRDVDL